MPVAVGWLLLAAVAGAAAAPTRMAVLPAGSVSGVDELLEVYEELSVRDSPIVFMREDGSVGFTITKTGTRGALIFL